MTGDIEPICRSCGEKGDTCLCTRTGRKGRPAHTQLDEVAAIARAIRARLFELETYITYTDHQIEGRAATILLDKCNNLRWLTDNIERVTSQQEHESPFIAQEIRLLNAKIKQLEKK